VKCAALLFFLIAQDAKPEPGPLSVDDFEPRAPRITAVKGNAQEALKTFLEAHRAHKQDKHDAALRGYLAFLGIAARAELPPRYQATARARLDSMLAKIRTRFDAGLALYVKDRKQGVAEMTLLAVRYPMLPEGAAAKALWHSDGLHAAIASARAESDRKLAAVRLEQAVRRYAAALFRYEAKSLLIELGGLDLFEPGERVGKGEDKKGDEKKDEDDGGTVIEMGDD